MISLGKTVALAAVASVAAGSAALSAAGLDEGADRAGEGETMKLKLLSDSVVATHALNLVSGPFGTCINGQTFQQEALVSFKGWQYATFFAEGGALCVARRRLPDGAWQTIRFTDYAIHHDDVHNVAVIGIDEEDGTVHLSYDHHNSPFHYRRSVPGLATDPEKAVWDAVSFGPTTDELVPGKPIGNVTYPQFFRTPYGRLQILYRLGSSGNGDWYLAEYDPVSGGWTVLGMLFSRRGDYATSPSRCAYPNPLRYDARSRLHVTWCWRERPANGVRDLRTNHDLCYAYSDDFGRTWKNNAGEVIAVLSGGAGVAPATIAIDTPGIVVRNTRFLWGQMNTTTQDIDSQGRVHVIHWQHDQNAEEASVNLNTWLYYHYWRDTAGVWHENRLPFVGRKPQMVVDAAGRAWVVHLRSNDRRYHGQDPGGMLTVVTATEKSGWADWTVAWSAEISSVGEPLLDADRWRRDQVISIYTQMRPAAPGAPSLLRVMDLGIK